MSKPKLSDKQQIVFNILASNYQEKYGDLPKEHQDKLLETLAESLQNNEDLELSKLINRKDISSDVVHQKKYVSKSKKVYSALAYIGSIAFGAFATYMLADWKEQMNNYDNQEDSNLDSNLDPNSDSILDGVISSPPALVFYTSLLSVSCLITGVVLSCCDKKKRIEINSEGLNKFITEKLQDPDFDVKTLGDIIGKKYGIIMDNDVLNNIVSYLPQPDKLLSEEQEQISSYLADMGSMKSKEVLNQVLGHISFGSINVKETGYYDDKNNSFKLIMNKPSEYGGARLMSFLRNNGIEYEKEVNLDDDLELKIPSYSLPALKSAIEKMVKKHESKGGLKQPKKETKAESDLSEPLLGTKDVELTILG